MAWRSIESVIQTAEALCEIAGRHCADDRTGIGAPPTKILMVGSSSLSSHRTGAREKKGSRTGVTPRIVPASLLRFVPLSTKLEALQQILEMVWSELTRCVGKM